MLTFQGLEGLEELEGLEGLEGLEELEGLEKLENALTRPRLGPRLFKALFLPSWTVLVTPCWAYVGSFFGTCFALKMRSYLEVALRSIVDR